jgi:hypothetical protein
MSMAKCDVCGNDYEMAFTATTKDRRHSFDSFEGTIHSPAPNCGHCGCKVIGHGVEDGGIVFCCVHGAQQFGVSWLQDLA